ncbi:MAG: hypothetical protein N3D11_08300 [Candidatus Sumerlaeia bacterium]|nr:hypothetical protein [Candidatus Sumerlaeia bacterium]
MNTVLTERIQPSGGQGVRELKRMAWMVGWAALLTILGLAQVWLPMAIRDLDMQRNRLMAQATDLLARENELRSEVTQLRSGNRRQDFVLDRAALQPVAPDRQEVWDLPPELEQRIVAVCMEIETTRGSGSERPWTRDPWLVRMLATIFPPGSQPAVPKAPTMTKR